ncbi:MAG: tetratricopeptide repeat protein [Acidobacteria bacterium]|nr:tetratricopeptide repeat protein [Acidobacteriota bacterium]
MNIVRRLEVIEAPPVLEPSSASIAVLPFADMSLKKDQEYFTDGLSEELLNVLGQVPGLRVAGRTSSFQFKGKSEDLRVIGEKLNVASLLEGSVRKAGNRVRITARLVNSADGLQLWSKTYDRELEDIFAVQEEIARSLVGALKGSFLGENERLTQVRGQNAAAYNAYLQGRYFLERRSEEDVRKALDYFRDALTLDPGYALAWTGLSSAHLVMAGYGYVPVKVAKVKARDAAERALALDDTLPEAWAALGFSKMSYDWDWLGAEAAFLRALALNPGSTDALQGAASLAVRLGRLDKGINLGRRVVGLDPLNDNEHRRLGTHFYYAGRLEEAEVALTKALELNPARPSTQGLLGEVYLAQSKPEAAFEYFEKLGRPKARLFGLALTYSALGRQHEAESALAQLREDHPNSMMFQIASVYAYWGQPDQAFEWLERAYTLRDGGLSKMKVYPLLESLHDDPRWEPFLVKMSLDG